MTADLVLPAPSPGPDAAVAWVGTHLGDPVGGDVSASPAFRGASMLRTSGWLRSMSRATPRGAAKSGRSTGRVRRRSRRTCVTGSGLPALWAHVRGGPARDVAKYRNELLWQEYARHVYARFGTSMTEAAQFVVSGRTIDGPPPADVGWPRDMARLELTAGELERDGWVPN